MRCQKIFMQKLFHMRHNNLCLRRHKLYTIFRQLSLGLRLSRCKSRLIEFTMSMGLTFNLLVIIFKCLKRIRATVVMAVIFGLFGWTLTFARKLVLCIYEDSTRKRWRWVHRSWKTCISWEKMQISRT